MAALLAVACAAPNPERSRPSRSSASKRGAADSEAAVSIGRVGQRELALEGFLARLWMRENAVARDVLEQLVLAELVGLESSRWGMGLDSAELEALLGRSEGALRARLAEVSPGLTIDQHVRRNLGLDPGFYRRQLEGDAVVQLLAERCVRAHSLSTPRALVRILDLDEASAAEVEAELAAGEPFAAVADRHGGETLTLMRAEGNELARLAFATEAGAVAGPVVKEGHHVWIGVERFLEPLEPSSASIARGSPWLDVREAVEASLAAEPVGDREFVQWRHRMVERYAVDLGPFQALVGDPGP